MFAKKELYSLEKISCKSSSAGNDFNKIDCKDISSSKQNNQSILKTKFKVFVGIFYLSIHSICIQLISVIVKQISYMSVSQISLIRYVGILSAALPIVIYYNANVLGEKKYGLLLFFRSLLGANGLYLQIIAYRYLQLIEASIVMSACPFLTTIFARIFLKETLGLIHIITLIISTCGILLTLRLPEFLSSDKTQTEFNSSRIVGLTTAIGGVLCLSLSTVAMRKLRKVHFSIIMLHMSFWGIIENIILNATVFPFVTVSCGWDQLLCILVGITAVGANVFLIFAVKLEAAGLVAVQKFSLDILVITVFQILFFSKYPDVYVITGACLVLISLTIIGIKNWVITLPETSKKRQKLKWILI